MRKKYVSPELELLILEQSDIITVSGHPGVDDSSGNEGAWDEWD